MTEEELKLCLVFDNVLFHFDSIEFRRMESCLIQRFFVKNNKLNQVTNCECTASILENRVMDISVQENILHNRSLPRYRLPSKNKYCFDYRNLNKFLWCNPLLQLASDLGSLTCSITIPKKFRIQCTHYSTKRVWVKTVHF